MTRTGKRLIQDFIVPALESQKYGELLHWVDRSQMIFQIKWSHKNAARWSSQDTNVFQDWDRLKGHYHPEKEGYFMQAKQRFRAALQKLKSYVERLKYQEKNVKRYRLLNPDRKVKNEKEKKHVRKTVKAIPTSVIRQNISYNGNVASTSSWSSTSPPSSPPSPASSEESDHYAYSNESSELEMLEQSYKSTQAKQMREYAMLRYGQCYDEETMSDDEVSDFDQKENLQNVALLQPPPAHVCSDLVQVYGNLSTPRFESPKILLVRTHYESRPKPMGAYNVGCAIRDVDTPSYALNLSVKQDVK